MITYLKKEEYSFNDSGDYDKGAKLIEIACLSTDTKPTTGIVSGSLAIEVNTGDIYVFDAEGTSWTKL
jgi:hypothetical protein